MRTNIIRDLDECLDLLIDEQQIVAIFQGESEWGPRALGNRSIMLEHAEDYFEMLQLKESPWMSFAIKAKPLAYKMVPTLVHADGTCRIQTVTEEQNPNYYNLIKGFYERTGVPMIFNTSFNLGGDALVETIFDAIDTCNRSEINQLYIPEDQDIVIPIELIHKVMYLMQD